MKLFENDDVGHDLGDSFLDLKLARLADGRILAVPAFHNAAALILPGDVALPAPPRAGKQAQSVANSILDTSASHRATFTVGELALWLVRVRDVHQDFVRFPARPDLSLNLSIVRAGFAALCAYAPRHVAVSGEALGEVVPAGKNALLRVSVGSCVLSVACARAEGVHRTDTPPGEWVRA